MLSLLRDLYWAYLSLTGLVVVVFGYVAATASAGTRKGRARLIAALAFSSFFLISPALWTFYESQLPVFEADGLITAVQVRDGSSRHYSAQLWIATGDTGEVSVHVSDRSSAWHVGQRLRVRYYGDTGELIRANLMSSDGHPQGTVRSSSGFTRAASVLLGVALMWAILKRYRRDPEALTEDQPELSSVSAAVDQDSLLHLSKSTTSSESTGSTEANVKLFNRLRRDAPASATPTDRPLTEEEGRVVEYLLRNAAPPQALAFIPQIASARVTGYCPCGCPTVDLSVPSEMRVQNPPPDRPLADATGRVNGKLVGVMLFQEDGLLSLLEGYRLEDVSDDPFGLPAVETLERLQWNEDGSMRSTQS